MYANPAQVDATASFVQDLNDPRKWVIRSGVPIFKSHVRKDPATGQTITVDVPKLYRIAANMQRLEQGGGVPARGTLGHTEPGKPETQQPPVATWYRNARVQPFGPRGEPAIVVDEWLDPQYAHKRKDYPFRSAEYYDDTEQITGVALLTRDPYLDLGVVAYTRSAPGPLLYSQTGQPRPHYCYAICEETMYPPTNPAAPGVAPAPQPGQHPGSAPAANPGYAQYQQPRPGMPAPGPAPVGYANPTFANPTAYNYGPQGMRPPARMGSQDMGYTPQHNIGHAQNQHWGPHGGVAFAAGQPGSGMPGVGPSGPGESPMNPAIPGHTEPEEDSLHMLHHHLTQSAACLAKYFAGKRGTQYEPPQGPMNAPFPPQDMGGGMGGMGPGTAEQPYARYAHHGVPTTMSGRPISYQMELDRLNYQLAQQNETLKLVMYERDQADTAACAAEIGKLAAVGYMVGDEEVYALKACPTPQHRAAYIQNIVTKYQRVGTEQLPPIMGDPTPTMYGGQDPNANRPLTQAEMDQAVKLTESDPRITLPQAYQYVRSGQAPMQYGGQLFQDPYPSGANGDLSRYSDFPPMTSTNGATH